MKRFCIDVAPANPKNTINVGALRISVLTPSLVRIERGQWTDLPTQQVWYRDLGEVAFSWEKKGANVRIKTEKAEWVISSGGRIQEVYYQGKPVSYRRGNLGGTARTLDNTNGAISVGRGIVGRGGAGVMYDDSLLLKEDKVLPREKGSTDTYCFAYGHNFRGCMQDFYAITGQVPLIPRYVLGNWWSRYKAYSQEEYLALMDKFEREEIPLTVATIDMDWHWVDVLRRFGPSAKPTPSKNLADKLMCLVMPGWTGYTWNTELFPDYRAFLDNLKARGYHITLNVHPSNGLRSFEVQYEDMCRAVGQEPNGKYVPLRFGDERYLHAYFDVLHHPYEAEGVDFWWLDWQQGTHSDVKGLDPLWALNHYHYLDSDRADKRPLILSRYAGPGSHRYPLGFSGDAAINWPCLKFQPYFTSTAANVGYTWWSHDIGGHRDYGKDDQLYLRWVQFGVFSPINRLHSSSNEFMGKEPWKCAPHVARIVTDTLRLRHRLIPYIYSAAYQSHSQGIALCEPMYYRHPEEKMAYAVPNEYYFGDQLIVAPITRPINHRTQRAYVDVWLPEGTYTDWFTGDIYEGGRTVRMCRGLDSIPVLAKAGSIVPTYAPGSTTVDNDQPMVLRVYHGNGQFSWYEDDGESKEYQRGVFATTLIEQKECGQEVLLRIHPCSGDSSVLPATRVLRLDFADIVEAQVEVNGVPADKPLHELEITYAPNEGIEILLKNCAFRQNTPIRERMIDMISSFQGNNLAKQLRWARFVRKHPFAKVRAGRSVKACLKELQDMFYPCKK